LIPKSIPTLSLIGLCIALSKSPSIKIEAKYLPVLVFVIVIDLIDSLFLKRYRLSRSEHLNFRPLIVVVKLSFDFSSSKVFFDIASFGNLAFCSSCFALNLGNPLFCLKKFLYANSKLIMACLSTLVLCSFSHSLLFLRS
jgi:hypothetical protein